MPPIKIYIVHNPILISHLFNVFFRHALKRHMLYHNGDKSHICLRCGQEFASTDGLRNHEKRHGAAGEFSCSFCDFTHVAKYYITSHEKVNLLTWNVQSKVCSEFESHCPAVPLTFLTFGFSRLPIWATSPRTGRGSSRDGKRPRRQSPEKKWQRPKNLQSQHKQVKQMGNQTIESAVVSCSSVLFYFC